MTASDWASGASLVEAVGIARLMGRRARPAALYPHARGSVLVPLALFGLPERIEADGAMWALKDEFYVTAVHTPWLAQRAGVSLERAWQELSAALEGRRAGPVRIGDELRIVRASSYARFARARSGWSSARRRSCRTAVPS